MYVQRVVPEAVLPVRQSPGAAGYDLTSVEDVRNLGAGDRICVSTGIKIKIPAGYYGRIAPRSGLAVKQGIDVGAGVVDSDYRGVVGVLLINHSKYPVSLPAGTRVAQMIIEKIATPCVVEISADGEIPGGETARGTGGFGSTGH